MKSDKSRTQHLKMLLRSKSFVAGICMFVPMLLLGFLGPLFISPDRIKILAYPKELPPSLENPLGTDIIGRDILAQLILSLRLSLLLGIFAGGIGIAIGTVIGFIAGYKGGLIDDALRNITDIFLVIPTWCFVVVISAYIARLTVPMLALLLASLSWPGTARRIRSQVMSLRERPFIDLARISGERDTEIIFKEILPNLLPYLGMCFAGAMTGAMMAEVGLGIIGLGPEESCTLGIMIHWANYYGAIVKGMWWWLLPPIICIIFVFLGLNLINIGLDEIYNPRLRKVTGL